MDVVEEDAAGCEPVVEPCCCDPPAAALLGTDAAVLLASGGCCENCTACCKACGCRDADAASKKLLAKVDRCGLATVPMGGGMAVVICGGASLVVVGAKAPMLDRSSAWERSTEYKSEEALGGCKMGGCPVAVVAATLGGGQLADEDIARG